MRVFTVITVFCVLSICMIFAGGAFFAVGSETAGIALAGLDAGWMGILFGVMMRIAANHNPVR